MRKFCLALLALALSSFNTTTGGNATGRCIDTSSEVFIMIDPINDLKKIEELGDKAGAQKDWNLALKYYSELVKKSPNVANYHYKYGGVLGMMAKECSKFKALGMIGEIKESFETAIRLDKNHIQARYALIELYLELPGIVGGSERKANKYASELMKISVVDGYLAKGRIAEYFKRFKQAEAFYAQAHQIGNSSVTKQKLINLYKQTKQFDKLKALS